MKKWKHHPLRKGLTLLLAVVLACGLLTALTPSAAASETSGSCGENLTWVFDETTGTLTISGEGEMTDFTIWSVPWYDYRYDIKEVCVNSGVTSIGDNAFWRCANLSSVSLSNTLNRIGASAFDQCEALSAIDIPENVTKIGGGAFSYCNSLESVIIPDSVSYIGGFAFCSCHSLKNVTIPDTVSYIGGKAFIATPWLDEQTGFVIAEDGILLHYHGTDTDLVIPSGVKYIPDFFWTLDGKGSGRYSDGPGEISTGSMLNSVTFPEGLLEIGEEAFDDFKGTEVYFPSTLRSIGSATFYNAWNLTSAYFYGDAPNVGMGAFKTGGRSMQEPVVLHYIDGKSGWTSPIWSCVPPVEIAGYTEYPTETWDGRIPYAVEGGNIYFNAETGAIVDADETITAANIPEKIKGWDVCRIGECAFAECSSLKEINIPANVSEISSTAFSGCKELNGIWVDEQNEFYSSDDFGVLFDKNQATLIRAPGGLQGSYTIPDGVTWIWGFAFEGCSSLTDVTIPDSVTCIDEWAFIDCSGLTRIAIPGSVTDFGQGAFIDCTNLTNLTIAEGVTSISRNAFSGCVSLTSVIIPESVENIYSRAFNGCKSLTSITIRNSKCKVYCIGEKSELVNSTLGTPGFTMVYSYEGATGCVKDMDGTGVLAYYPQSYAETFGYDFKLIAQDEPNPPQPVENPFTDVTENCYFYEPVLWSVEHGITQGITETTFGPERS